MKFKFSYSLNAIIGVLVTFALFFYINYEEMIYRDVLVAKESAKVKETIKNELKKVNLVLEALSFTMVNTPHMNNDLFNSYTGTLIKKLNGIEALKWAPKVNFIDKDSFEIAAKIRHNNKNYRINTHNSDNQLIVSKDKAYYFPVEYINPLTSNEKMVGFDISSNDVRNNSVVKTYKCKKTVIHKTNQISFW